jgi:hypothetical protein
MLYLRRGDTGTGVRWVPYVPCRRTVTTKTGVRVAYLVRSEIANTQLKDLFFTSQAR